MDASGNGQSHILGPARQPGRLVLATAAAIIVLVLVTGAALAIQRHDRERARVLDESAQDARTLAARVEQLFDERFEILETIAATPLVQDGAPSAIKAWFERLVANGSSFTGGLSLVGTDGVMILLSGYPLDEPPIDLSDRDYVRGVLATGRRALGDAIVGRRSGDPLLTFAVPVPAADGSTASILAGTVRLDLPEGGLARIGSSLEQAAIIDGSGQVVVDKGSVPMPTAAADSFLSAVGSGPGASDAVPGTDGTGTWVAGYAPIADTGWVAVVVEEPDAALGPASRSLLLELAVVASIAIATALIAFVTSRRLDRAAAEQHRERTAIVEREAFLRRFADALPVLSGTVDDSLNTTFANRTLRETGTPDLSRLVVADDLERLHACLRPGGEGVADVRIADPSAADGARWHSVRFVPAPELPGSWLFAAVDIDAEKRAELGMRRDIEQRDEFLGLVSHELRTPLTVIAGNVAAVRRRFGASLPDEALDGLKEIDTSGRQLERLLENMLVLSQVEHKDADAAIEPQVVVRLIARVVREFGERFPDPEVRVSVPDGLPIVAANATFVDQVMWNLLTNAAKYGDPAEPIDVSAREEAGWVVILVEDRGPGVPLDELDRVFEPHFRSRVAKRRTAGLGLGLSVCRRLIELQGGTIQARPRPGGGLSISFTLPTIDE